MLLHQRRVASADKLIFAVVLICGATLATSAGLRGPGKYSGVVIFDRWDSCLLLSGPYITYISRTMKDDLRAYAGKSIQIDAMKVSQPENPGDALVQKYKVLGPAPKNEKWAVVDGLELSAESDFGSQGPPAFLIEIRNTGTNAVTVTASEFGPTLLGLNPKSPFCASDDKSGAWLTRTDLTRRESSWKCMAGGVSYSASSKIDPASEFPERFRLAFGESRKSRIIFRLKFPPGRYQFLVGYGGGVHEEKSIASNIISFDLDARGKATLAGGERSANHLSQR
jgi:hypothetical protein